MITYDLMLDRQRLIGADKFSVAANANETLSLRFHFDRHWRRFDSKAAVFRNTDGEYYIIEVKDFRAQVPWEVLKKKGSFELSVIGYEEEKVISSEMVEIEVVESLLPEDYKAFSPTEVLFDRFKRECFAQAYLEYEDEITQLKKSHLAELIRIAQDVSESNAQYEARLKEKDEEIRQIELEHTAQTNTFKTQLADMNDQIEYYKEKADKWDLVDFASSLKTTSNQLLWSSSSEPFHLPMMNTSSVVTFTQSSFGNNLKSIGLNLKSTTSFANIFTGHKTIERIELINANNITTYTSAFETCKSIRTILIDNMDSCSSLSKFLSDATNVLSVTFGTEVQAGNYERTFYNCRLLKEINGTLNFEYATSIGYMFYNCYSLEKVNIKEDSLSRSLSFGDSAYLSKESMISIFKSLSPVNSGTLAISGHAFETNFTPEERSAWLDYVTETKAWALTIQ